VRRGNQEINEPVYFHRVVRVLIFPCLLSAFVGYSAQCLGQSQPAQAMRPRARKVVKSRPQDTPETLLGDRLFFETRFSRYFAVHSNGDVNHSLAEGDPVVSQVLNPQAKMSYPSRFAGKSINCRTCHFVNEYANSSFQGGTGRAYADFLQRSMVPKREDGRTLTVRNARNMVDDFTPRRGELLLHGDGEFASVDALVESVLVGRTFGWLSTEHDEAIHHIAKVIREDDGSDNLGQQYGGSYAKLMLGTDPDLLAQFRLSSNFRIDVKTATDQEIVYEVTRLIGAFLKSLQFEHTSNGTHTGSAYDMFLAKNNLPPMPASGESDEAYSQRLLQGLEQLQNPRFVVPDERVLRFHPHTMQFGERELAGLKLFLRQGAPSAKSDHSLSHTGNCVRCHPAPDFTDVHFHNTGAAQEEYDAVHGAGTFAQLHIPSHAERSLDLARYLPCTASHPQGTGIFRSTPSANNPSATDLGLWNVYANPDYPNVQEPLRKILCAGGVCDPNVQLPKTIAMFRTPTLRDLGNSWPYLHTGRMATTEDVLHFYVQMSGLARAGKLRNGAPELRAISLDEQDIAALVAFLRSLDEDYDN